MNKVKIITDSTCDLPPQLLERFDISVIPMYVNLGDDSYRDGVDITPQQIFAYVERTRQTPKTAAVTLLDFQNAFRPWVEAGMDVLYVGISAIFSSSVPNAMIVASEFPAGRVEVVDSMNLSTGLGMQVVLAGELMERGLSAAEIAARLRAAAPRVRASFIIDTLLYLYRGGRCSALQAFGANALQLKPSIVVVDGGMRPDKKYRGNIVRCAEKYAEDVLAGAVHADQNHVYITHSPAEPEIVDTVRNVVERAGLFREVHVTDAGCVITSHCGPNTIGVLYMERE